jgi:lysozyme
MASRRRKRFQRALWFALGVVVVALVLVRFVPPVRHVAREIFHRLFPVYEPVPPGKPSPYTTKIKSGFSVHGIDVSTYQSRIDWKIVKQEGFEFAFIKATEGVWLEDRFFEMNWHNAKEAGLLRGAYHFFLPRKDAKLQAENFLDVAKLKKGDLPSVLDIETDGGISAQKIRKGVKTWLTHVQNSTGVQPIIYTNYKFYMDYLKGHFENYPVWIAHYHVSKPKLKEHRPWTFWQYHDRARIKGLRGEFDFNVFNGSRAQLQKMCRK